MTRPYKTRNAPPTTLKALYKISSHQAAVILQAGEYEKQGVPWTINNRGISHVGKLFRLKLVTHVMHPTANMLISYKLTALGQQLLAELKNGTEI